MLTLACRPVGAFIFGRLADHFGRRPVLMLDIALYSVLSFLIAFTPNILAFYIACAAFGVAMGGVWGICASLSMETIKPQARGFVSGLLQSGYPSGFLISSLVFGYLYPIIGWRGMFMVGVIPAALLILYIYMCVPESRFFSRESARQKNAGTIAILRAHGKVALFAIILMTGFNFFSHGTQDVYTTFLRVQHHFDPATVKNVAGDRQYRRHHRRAVLGLLQPEFRPAQDHHPGDFAGAAGDLFLVAIRQTAVALAVGAFLMQVCVQGAWGVVPAHLNELAPAAARGTFAGTGLSAGQSDRGGQQCRCNPHIAEHAGGDYGSALAIVAAAPRF